MQYVYAIPVFAVLSYYSYCYLLEFSLLLLNIPVEFPVSTGQNKIVALLIYVIQYMCNIFNTNTTNHCFCRSFKSDIYFIYSALYIYLYRSKKDPRSLTKNIQQT